jgi:hypothetical protein
MGLTAWKGDVVQKSDVTVAKNYLNQDEISALNRIVTMWLVLVTTQKCTTPSGGSALDDHGLEPFSIVKRIFSALHSISGPFYSSKYNLPSYRPKTPYKSF